MLQGQALFYELASDRTMNISQLAKAANVSTDTVRYYEKQGRIDPPERQSNGYRLYTDAHAGVLRFVLTEIRGIVPLLAQGQLSRADIEHKLQAKMAQIEAHIQQLQTLKKELADCADTPSGTVNTHA